MLPLQAHGYRSGLSASPGFLQIRHTSSSSSSSSYFTATDEDDVIATAFGSFSFDDDDVLTASADAASSGTSRSVGGGGAGAISIGRVRGVGGGGCVGVRVWVWIGPRWAFRSGDDEDGLGFGSWWERWGCVDFFGGLILCSDFAPAPCAYGTLRCFYRCGGYVGDFDDVILVQWLVTWTRGKRGRLLGSFDGPKSTFHITF